MGGEDEQGAAEGCGARGGGLRTAGGRWLGSATGLLLEMGTDAGMESWGEGEAGGVSFSRKKVVRPDTAWAARGGGEGVEPAESRLLEGLPGSRRKTGEREAGPGLKRRETCSLLGPVT